MNPTRVRGGIPPPQPPKSCWARYRDLIIAVVNAPLFSGFCYTQFADTFQEINGLLFADRTPKIPLEKIAEATRHSRTYIPGAA